MALLSRKWNANDFKKKVANIREPLKEKKWSYKELVHDQDWKNIQVEWYCTQQVFLLTLTSHPHTTQSVISFLKTLNYFETKSDTFLLFYFHFLCYELCNEQNCFVLFSFQRALSLLSFLAGLVLLWSAHFWCAQHCIWLNLAKESLLLHFALS